MNQCVLSLAPTTVAAEAAQADRRGMPSRAALLALAAATARPDGVGSQACPSGDFWQPDELPEVHQLNFVVAQAAFENIVAHQMQYDLEITGELTFNQETYQGVELQVRAVAAAPAPVGICLGFDRVTPTRLARPSPPPVTHRAPRDLPRQVHGGRYQRAAVSKPSFRLKWPSGDPFGAKHANPFSYPKTGCNNMKKMTLRGEVRAQALPQATQLFPGHV